MNRQFIEKFIRYGGSSLLALGADMGTLAALFYILKLPYLMAAGLAFVFGSLVKYVVSKHMVYDDNREGKEPLTILAFIVIAFGALLANQTIIYIGVEFFNAHLLVVKIFSAGIIFVANFFLLGFFVFKDPLYEK